MSLNSFKKTGLIWKNLIIFLYLKMSSRIPLPSNWRTGNPKTTARKMLDNVISANGDDNLMDAINHVHQQLAGTQKLIRNRYEVEGTLSKSEAKRDIDILQAIRQAMDEIEEEMKDNEEEDNEEDNVSENEEENDDVDEKEHVSHGSHGEINYNFSSDFIKHMERKYMNK